MPVVQWQNGGLQNRMLEVRVLPGMPITPRGDFFTKRNFQMKVEKANCGASVSAHMGKGKKVVKAAKGGIMSIGGVKKMDEPMLRKGGMVAGVAKGAKMAAEADKKAASKGELMDEKKAVGARKGGMVKKGKKGGKSGY